MILVEIEDCKRCLLNGPLVRCVKLDEKRRTIVAIQVLDKDGQYKLLEERTIGKCAVTQENIREIAMKFAELAEKHPSMGWGDVEVDEE